MSLLFTDDYKKCRCGSKSFLLQPIYSVHEKEGLMLTSQLLQCLNCKKEEHVSKDYGKQ